MSLASLLLRIVLSLALILEGSVPAMASAAAAMPSSPASHAMPMTRAVEATPCHAHHGMHTNGKAGWNADTRRNGRPMPDCCNGGGCPCACAQVAQHASTPALVGALVLQHPELRMPPRGHIAPALPHLIRPPIA